jgi:hypothetical protein
LLADGREAGRRDDHIANAVRTTKEEDKPRSGLGLERS